MEYDLPIEVTKKIEEFFALRDCKEIAVKYSFFEGRALSYARKANKLWDTITEDIYAIYPELENRNWSVNKKASKIKIVVNN